MSQAENIAAYQQFPMVGRCAFCPDYSASGTAQEVRQFNEAHRKLEHPELDGKRRRKYRRANVKTISFRQSLTDEEVVEVERTRQLRMKLLGQTGE